MHALCSGLQSLSICGEEDASRGRIARQISAYEARLRRCGRDASLRDGKLVHGHLRRSGLERYTFLGNLLVQMYGKCGSIQDAEDAFLRISDKDEFSWNIMIAAFAANGQIDRAREMFEEMPHRDVVSWNAMLAMLVMEGKIEEAEQLFGSMPEKSAASWNTLVAAYARNDEMHKAFSWLWRMCLEGTKPNEITFISVLEACSLREGKLVHEIVRSSGLDASVKVANALISMYGECSSMANAERVFQSMQERNVVTWTAMIVAYAQNGEIGKARSTFDRMSLRNVVSWNAMIHGYAEAGQSDEALQLFEEMDVKPNRGTFMSVLVSGLELEDGERVHSKVTCAGYESDVYVATALLTMYGMCGEVERARCVFEGIEKPDLVAWNALIGAWLHHGDARAALEVFFRMSLEGVVPNEGTLFTTMDACANLSSKTTARMLHCIAEATSMVHNLGVSNAMVNMFGKCGDVESANSLFQQIPHKDVVSWNVGIAMYGQNGLGAAALHHFMLMILQGFEPDAVTFLVLLSACSHAGFFNEGLAFLQHLQDDWGLEPCAGHYLCAVDILGRAGELSKAENLVDTMPYEPEEVAWRALLGSCRINTDILRGERAAGNLLVIEPEDSSPYILMSNMYASVGSWKKAAQMRQMMRNRKVKKLPGLSWIEIRGKVHTFAAGDRDHPDICRIHGKLEQLKLEMRNAGYEPELGAALHDVDDTMKAKMLLHHSEKLAMAYGLLNTPEGAPLLITKNIRVCVDCHSATKFIARITRRKIVMRDTSRYHHFDERGVCSCGDYW